MEIQYLDFEKPVEELERKITELKSFALSQDPGVKKEIDKLERRLQRVKNDLYNNLSAWQKTLLSRHLQRPYTLDYIALIFTDFTEFHGDRCFREDPAMVGGPARFKGEPVMVIGHQKGRTTQEKLFRNFGMPHPEGYRKALRLMKLAERFSRPIITFIDTPGAYPGVEAEERGQAEAIARNLKEMALLKVPLVSVVIGEGGSGGALALGVADRVLMMEHTIYSVISPEGCAAILWRDAGKSTVAAEALRLTAQDAFELKMVDALIKEPLGGAHRDYEAAAANLALSLKESMDTFSQLSTQELLSKRWDKFRRMGVFNADQLGGR